MIRRSTVLFIAAGLFGASLVFSPGLSRGHHMQDILIDDKGIVHEILETNRRTYESIALGDLETLDEIYGDEYVWTGPDGSVLDKEQRLRRLAALNVAGSGNSESFELIEVDVRPYGNTAVVIGSVRLYGVYNGHSFDNTYRYTTTYVRRNDRWRAVAHQATTLAV